MVRTVVAVPPGWVERDGGATLAPAGDRGDLVVELAAPRPKPLDPAAFLRELAAQVAPGHALRVLSTTVARTDCDWPYDRLDVLVTDASGATVEGRIIAAYRFLSSVAVITVRARNRDALLAARPAVDALLASARPDWRGDHVAALVELWG